MKSIQVSEDILPLARFKSQASEVLRKLHGDARPVVITQNGKPAAVLVTPELFDRMAEQMRFVEAVNAGLRDADAGRVIDDAELDRHLEEAFAER